MRTIAEFRRVFYPFEIDAHCLWRGSDVLLGVLVGSSYYDPADMPFNDSPSLDLRFNVHLVVLSFQLSITLHLPSK